MLKPMSYRCRTHPSYIGKRQPRSKCATCLAVYSRNEMLHEAVARAAKTISDLLPDQKVSVRADFDGIPAGKFGLQTTAIRVDMLPKPRRR